MSVFLNDPDVRLYHGDVLETLRQLPDESVDCVVTSPPYWGLRDYGTGEWAGGDPDCDHQAPKQPDRKFTNGRGENEGYAGTNLKSWTDRDGTTYRDRCGKCGATRVDQQLGLEPTPDLFVQNMVAVFREVRRVLADHGTCWVNLGDSYANPPPSGTAGQWAPGGSPIAAREAVAGQALVGGTLKASGLKQKDLCGIPWRVAFALQADGWWLRSDIIWAKPNPMPESVTDRPTKAHEYVFLLTKRPRYWFDAEAVREEYAPKTLTHRGGGKAAGKVGQQDGTGKVPSGNFGEWDKPRTAFPRPRPQDETLEGLYECLSCGVVKTKADPTDGCGACGGELVRIDGEPPRGPDGRRQTHVQAGDASIQHRDGERWPNAGRNVRSVWNIATQPYPEAHFATFPEELARRCILAGCPTRVCRVCGKPSERIVDAITSKSMQKTYRGAAERISHGPTRPGTFVDAFRETLGWSDCGHNNWRPGLVLDPFIGSGTTAKVARDHARHAIGIDLNHTYLELAARRLQQLSLLAEA